MNNQNLKEYHSALIKEGLIKSLICAFIAGFFTSFIAALVMLILGYNGLWASVVVGLAAIAISAPFLYFFAFRPNEKEVAERIDRLGLDERVITMMQLEGDESYIAMRQKMDTKEKLNEVNPKGIKLSISKLSIVLVFALAALSVSMTALSVVFSDDATENPIKIEEPLEEIEYIRVSYVAAMGGYILGESEQLVVKGEESKPVVAIANEGFLFSGWSDDWETADRFDKNITKRIYLIAIFDEVQAQGGAPTQGGNNQGTTPTSGADGKYAPNNQIIDGQTYYRDHYQFYLDQAMEIISEGGEISDSLRSIIKRYFGVIL